MDGDEKERHEFRNYKIEFDGDEPIDISAIQASLIIRDVLINLDVPFNEIKINQFVEYVFESERGDVSVQFVGEEPEYWYAEADIQNKMVEVGVGKFVMRIPLMTILSWFTKDQKDNR